MNNQISNKDLMLIPDISLLVHPKSANIERILTRYLQVYIIPKYSEEEKAEYKKITDSAKNELSRRPYPFEAIAGDDERLTILGPVDRFEPYKTANRDRPEDPKQLLTEDSQGRRSIRMATQLRNPDTRKYLVPRIQKAKSKKRITPKSIQWLRELQGRKLLEEMSRGEILTEVKQNIINDFKISSEEIKNRNPIDYFLDRALDPLDPMNIVYRLILEMLGAVTDKVTNAILLSPQLKAIFHSKVPYIDDQKEIHDTNNRKDGTK